MSTLKVGQFGDDETALGKRDAFHVPGVLVKSKHPLKPGQDVRFTDEAGTEVTACGELEQRQAIVDPFLPAFTGGQLFWVFIEPSLVGGLVHSFEVTGLQGEMERVRAEAKDEAAEEFHKEFPCADCYGG